MNKSAKCPQKQRFCLKSKTGERHEKITAILIAATLLSGILPAVILQATPVPDVDGPYIADEGAEVIFDAGASTETEGGSLEFRWDFDNDGLYDTP